MSTEATGDGQPGADGAVEPDVTAQGEPAATPVDEPAAWDTAAPSAWGTPAPASPDVAAPAPPAPDTLTAPDESAADAARPRGRAAEPGAADADSDAADPAEANAANAGSDADAAHTRGNAAAPDAADAVAAHIRDNTAGSGAADQGAADPDLADPGSDAAAPRTDEEYDGNADDEVVEYYEEYVEYEEIEYEEEAADAPRRARRWPRVLLALGFVVLAAAIVGGAIAIVSSVTHGFKKPVKVTYKKSALFSLRTGECFNPRGQSYSLIPCDSPHKAEVFATFMLSGTKYPGATAIAAQASDGCTSRLTGYVNPQLAISLTQTYVYPDPVAWQAGTRTVICEVRGSSGQLTGSVRSATAS